MKINNTADLLRAKKKIHSAIGLYGQTASSKLEAKAKRDASWTDRTGLARNSIQGKFTQGIGKARVSLSGNTDYFVFLELANGRKHAILSPTLQAEANSILRGYQKVIR